jgi:hypothetical protein
MKNTGKLSFIFFVVLGLVVMATMVKPPVVSAADLSGTWLVSVETPAGKGTPTFVLKQDGNKITGTYKGAFGESAVAGTVDGDKFKLDYESSGNKIVYDGKIEGNKISGTASFGQFGDGPFTGEKK